MYRFGQIAEYPWYANLRAISFRPCPSQVRGGSPARPGRARAERPGEVGADLFVAVTGDRHRLGEQSLVHVVPPVTGCGDARPYRIRTSSGEFREASNDPRLEILEAVEGRVVGFGSSSTSSGDAPARSPRRDSRERMNAAPTPDARVGRDNWSSAATYRRASPCRALEVDRIRHWPILGPPLPRRRTTCLPPSKRLDAAQVQPRRGIRFAGEGFGIGDHPAVEGQIGGALKIVHHRSLCFVDDLRAVLPRVPLAGLISHRR